MIRPSSSIHAGKRMKSSDPSAALVRLRAYSLSPSSTVERTKMMVVAASTRLPVYSSRYSGGSCVDGIDAMSDALFEFVYF